MPTPDYIRSLREKIGTTVLEVPTVAVAMFDQQDRLLLVRHTEGGTWGMPGGMVDPYEAPADAAVREAWEETGLLVELTHVAGVLGGADCWTEYANGDRIAWVATIFGARRIGGTLRADGVETLDARHFSRDEIRALPRRRHADLFVAAAFARQPGGYFMPPTWRPPE